MGEEAWGRGLVSGAGGGNREVETKTEKKVEKMSFTILLRKGYCIIDYRTMLLPGLCTDDLTFES